MNSGMQERSAGFNLERELEQPSLNAIISGTLKKKA